MRRITEKNPKQFQKDINDIIQFKKSIYEYILICIKTIKKKVIYNIKVIYLLKKKKYIYIKKDHLFF